MSTLPPFRLHPKFESRTWGRPDLSPWYPATAQQGDAAADPIGEAWLTGPASVANDGPYAGMTLGDIATQHTAELLGTSTAEAEFPLLVKLLFPDAKLSVQVHPNDEEAAAMNIGRGKTECWYVLEATPGATVACGLKPGVAVADLRAAIADGTAEDLLEHLPVTKGDMVFVDAGTVHAIGPGVTILEVQQTSDTTYRLYDYDRPRELHLEKGLAVSKTDTRAGKIAPKPIEVGGCPGTRLIEEQYFTVDSFNLQAGDTIDLNDVPAEPYCLMALYGDAEVVSADARVQMPAGTSVIVPAGTAAVTVKAASAMELVRATP
ncbi:phosphomannose isomerase [Terriglobus roseus DSM 18391]|uniref:Phosphomannose isomerase n=1 Tax=Terriglobus roseus (strain DSM 18391 / NRRL B-41598 / KBS 63) TaxID=926566 RepID=I3ZMN6_TERRK|nr:type I phosphomannose isomerase catalytic subunit [Terriglobus roseus]AFL90504.1 phosphomannose isomerase [Terriglobus roseus DSM 18391]